MNKRILFIAPESYPVADPEAYVNAKLIKVLTEGGYVIDVVSRMPNEDRYPQSIPNNFFDLVNSVNVIPYKKTKKNLNSILRHFKAFLKFGNFCGGIDWANSALKICENMIKINHYDYIFTKSEPSEVLGIYLSKKYNIKWIASWNDPYIWDKYPQPYGKGWDSKEKWYRKKLKKDVNSYVYLHIFPSERLKNYMLQYMDGMKDEQCIIVPHILISSKYVQKEHKNEYLSIIHAGELRKERNPETFFNGIKLFVEQNKNPLIKITLLGVLTEQHVQLIEELELSEYIYIIPPVTYIESMNKIAQHDVCLLIEANLEEGIFLPSKVVDYLQYNKKILAISPKVGTINDMYKQGFIDYFADVTNPKEIASAITSIYNDFTKGEWTFDKKKDTSYFSEKNVLSIYQSILKD